MHMRVMRSVLAVLFLATTIMSAQNIVDTDLVPFNPAVKTGTLSNGIPYYILHNERPKNRLDLILTVNVGAVLEDDNQNGFAHFCEHMAFNGSKSFPKNALISFLESTGIRFGADLNAYTNQDETVYMLTLPTDKSDVVENGVKVLRDWAGYVTYADADIQAERGVVVEEWRTRQGAENRVNHAHASTLYFGSKYAVRDVTGDTAVLLRSEAENARRFYQTWYGPQNMAIIAVGDVDAAEFESMLNKLFVLPDGLEGRTKKRQTITLPNHADTKISIASDPELQVPHVEMWIKHPGDTVRTYGDYRLQIARRLVGSMLNSRFQELAQQAKPTITSAMTGWFSLVRENRMAYGRANASGKNVLVAFNTLMTEMERAKRHGFVPTELQRAKDGLMSSMEKYYNERNTTESGGLAQELARHVLEQESVPGIELEYAIHQHYVPMITAEECAAVFKEMYAESNRVFTFSVPEGNGYTTPTEAQVTGLLTAVTAKEIAAYEDKVPTEPLMASTPTPGTIVSSEVIDAIGGKKLTLSNGAVVYLKKTDFKADEILFQSSAFGGASLGDENDHFTLSTAMDVVDASGIATFGPNELQKMLQGKNIGISPFSARQTHGMRGQTSPKDLKTFMELIYLYHTAPRIDDDAIQSWKTRMQAQLEQRGKNAQAALIDTLQAVMSSYSPRSQPMTVEALDRIDPVKALAFYKMLFAGADDFTYTFVGNFDDAEMEEYIKTYIASLPATPGKMTWKEDGIERPTGMIKKEVYKGEDPKSFIVIAHHGEANYNSKSRFEINALAEVFTIRLRELIREEKGGVYSIAAQGDMNNIPNERYGVYVFFGCDPERANELIDAVKAEALAMQQNAVDADYVQKVAEIQKKEREVGKATNRFWLSAINQITQDGESWSVIAERDNLIADLSASQILNAAKKYLGTDNVAFFVQLPEKK